MKNFFELAKWIEKNSEKNITLSELSKKVGMSPFHFQKKFKETLGLTPKEYLLKCRSENLKKNLKKRSVSESIYEAGYGSSSRVYEKAKSSLGMTPKKYKLEGEGLEISYIFSKTKLGLMLLAATDAGICALSFGESKTKLLKDLKEEFPLASFQLSKKTREFSRYMNELEKYLEGQKKYFQLPLDLKGSVFQIKVWKFLQTIPYGETRSYSEVSQGIGQPTATRAVASACARNKISILIPCHRVIRSGGEISEYRWGKSRKRKLLKSEKK